MTTPAAQHYPSMTQPQRRLLREEYGVAQGGLCYHCKAPLADPPPDEVNALEIAWRLFPPNFLRYPVHLHHSHDTGMTLGAVHARCNAVLWQYYGE